MMMLFRSSASSSSVAAILLLAFFLYGNGGNMDVDARRVNADFAACCRMWRIPKEIVCSYSSPPGDLLAKFEKLIKISGNPSHGTSKVNEFFRCAMGNTDMTGCAFRWTPRLAAEWNECADLFGPWSAFNDRLQGWTTAKARRCLLERAQVRDAWLVCGQDIEEQENRKREPLQHGLRW